METSPVEQTNVVATDSQVLSCPMESVQSPCQDNGDALHHLPFAPADSPPEHAESSLKNASLDDDMDVDTESSPKAVGSKDTQGLDAPKGARVIQLAQETTTTACPAPADATMDIEQDIEQDIKGNQPAVHSGSPSEQLNDDNTHDIDMVAEGIIAGGSPPQPEADAPHDEDQDPLDVDAQDPLDVDAQDPLDAQDGSDDSEELPETASMPHDGKDSDADAQQSSDAADASSQFPPVLARPASDESPWELAAVEGAVNRKAARRDAKAKKNAEKAKQRQAKRAAEGENARQAQEQRVAEEASVRVQRALEAQAAALDVQEALTREEAARKKAAEDAGWAAVVVYGAQKREREVAEACRLLRGGTMPGSEADNVVSEGAGNDEANDMMDAEGAPRDSVETLSATPPMGDDEGSNAHGNTEPSTCQNSTREWLVAAVRGAEAQARAKQAKREAEEARKAAQLKEAEARRLEHEATVEVGKMEKLAAVGGKWRMQLWWSSSNPNIAAEEASKDATGPKRPRLVMMVHARA